MSEDSKQLHTACPNCPWAATTDEQGPRALAWLRAALDDHLSRRHPAVMLSGRELAFVRKPTRR